MNELKISWYRVMEAIVFLQVEYNIFLDFSYY